MRRFHFGLSVGLCLLSLVCLAEGKTNPPNIVLIMADDLGYTDLGCFGSKYYETPNIDRLASQGVRFTSGHSAGPNCQPTRAALLSGQYMPRTGVYTVGNIDRFNWRSRSLRPPENLTRLPLEKVTVAESLRKAGYATAMFGKWHLGDGEAHHPAKRGFDEAVVSSGTHFNFKTDPEANPPENAYLADFLTDKAIDFIRRKQNGPFFLYLPHFGVHAPYQARKELIEKFEKKAAVGGHHDPVYAAMLYSVDESVGRLLALLDELRLAENTLVVFTSDNGGVGGYQREGVKKEASITDNAPLRGGKGMLYEGGIRVPYIFRWSGKIPQGRASAEPIITLDLYPTFLEMAGARKPEGYPLDGESCWKLLAKGGDGNLKRDGIFWHFPGYLGAGENAWRTLPVGVVRSGDWKLMEFFEDGRLELYNLAKDVGEKENLIDTESARAKKLHARLVAWRKELNAPMPQPQKPDPSAKASGGKEQKKKKNRGEE